MPESDYFDLLGDISGAGPPAPEPVGQARPEPAPLPHPALDEVRAMPWRHPEQAMGRIVDLTA